MVRTMTAAMKTAAAAATGEAFHLFELNFSGGVQRLTDASNNVVFQSNTYSAIGGHLRFEAVQELPSLSGQGVRLVLDGVDQTVISAVLAENYIGRKCVIHRVRLDTGGAIIVDPVEIFNGFLNNEFEIRETGETVTVSTFVVSSLTRFSQTRGIVASLTSHQQHFSGDTFFRHVTAIAARKVFWGPGSEGGKGGTPTGPTDPSGPGDRTGGGNPGGGVGSGDRQEPR